MDLKTWIDQFPVTGRRDARLGIARATKVTEVAVRHWANGTRRVPAERVRDIEIATDGRVTREELRPDLFAAPRIQLRQGAEGTAPASAVPRLAAGSRKA